MHSFGTYLDCKTGGLKVGVNGLRCNFTELSKSEVQLAVGGAPKKKQKKQEENSTTTKQDIVGKRSQDEQKHKDLSSLLNGRDEPHNAV